MRTLLQPGPVHPRRIESFATTEQNLTYPLRTGVSLLEAATEPLINAGWRGGTLTFRSVSFNPFHYVIPGLADDDSHVAYFSAPRTPEGITRIEQANATFGWHDGKPLLHCHAVWTEADGARRGGHILPGEAIVVEPGIVHACGFTDVAIATVHDPETNFTLLQPSGVSQPDGMAVVARVRPNEDIITAVEAIARTHRIRDATIRGSLGSLIGARFENGTIVTDDATEVLVRSGRVTAGVAEIDLLAVDMQGRVHEGWLERGANPVCITFDLMLIRSDVLSGSPRSLP
jgi:predicted DNA-binding protein with PD1-like motif